MPLDDYAVPTERINSGVLALKKRQRNLMLLGITSSTVFIASIIAFFVQQDFVYGFFGLTTQVEQLHIPLTVDANLAILEQQPDYFLGLLSWFGWLFLKLLLSFIGAFFVVHFLKKIRFFYVRFQSFILKFVGWLIAFIMLWSGLTYLQYDLKNDDYDAQQKIVYYDKQLAESELARYLADAPLDTPVKSYLLAQTALLHQPPDKAAAIPHVLNLVKAEQQNPDFIQYGFKPEQLWSMQQQVYGKTLTPMAESVNKQVVQAERLSQFVQILVIAAAIVSAIFSLIFFVLAQSFKKRALRIEQRIF